jgi:aminomethyltransferase
MNLRKIHLQHIHENLGAKMVPFAGWLMPVRYSSDNEEHKTVRESVGIFDVSHMGEFIIKGPKALELIQKISSNDASLLKPGKIQYACLPNDKGGIVDDLLVYQLATEEYMLVVNASNIEKDWNWIKNHQPEGAEMINISDQTCLFAVQGPKAIETLQPLTDINLSDIPYYSFTIATFAGISNIIISATGYTGSGGFEIYVPNQSAEHIWNKIFESGSAYGIKPIGLGARDTLRLEMGYCLYGNDIDDTTSPIEAGLGWITKFNKPFIHAGELLKQKETGTEKKLIGFIMEERGIPRSHYPIFNQQGEQTGQVTSGTQSPSLGVGVGMGYIQTKDAKPGTTIWIEIRNKQLKARVTKLPFYKVNTN